jgi:hypothetical protein
VRLRCVHSHTSRVPVDAHRSMHTGPSEVAESLHCERIGRSNGEHPRERVSTYYLSESLAHVEHLVETDRTCVRVDTVSFV